ncbi:DUF637 domain-containing protein [Pseudomonas sp. zfem002]|nr:DUF637 domain-containing protein [Pseudomonas sp. zfem002]MDU9393749.1 DUF637 domain-containing protein [Pseudomonas sp. zfem002]
MAGNDIINSGLIEAANRVDLLAGNNIINKAGGIISGRDVSLTTILGNVINERSSTSHSSGDAFNSGRRDFLDSAARIEAANDLSIKAGQDLINQGGVLQSGRDTRLQAGRDVLLGSTEEVNALAGGGRTSQSIRQNGSSVTAGRDFSAVAGRDFAAMASRIDAQRDIAISAMGDVTLMSAADEEHSSFVSKKLKTQDDHVSQVATTLKAGGDVAISAGHDLAMSASRISAGDEAYLVAGGKLALLAAEDSDYSLYDMKKKGSFGSKKTQRDEITQITSIVSEITTGGDLTLESGSDQHYQAAKLGSGGDLTLDSGGDITFEAVKDLHQESHEKSKSDAGWFSMKGEGKTDETLRQSEMVAQGDLVIKAVGSIKADVLQVNQQTVHESIEAMVKADPKLAWLQQLEAQGGIDWRQVQEIHTSFKYANSGLGPAAQIVIAILMAAVLGPVVAGMAGGGIPGAVVGAMASSAATNATVSVVNNRGNLGAVFKDVTSSDAMKGYVIAGVTAGVTEGLIDPKLKGTNTALKSTAGHDLSTLQGIGGFSVRAGAIGLTSGVVKTAVNGGSLGDNLVDGLVTQASTVAAATAFNFIGSYAEKQYNAAERAGDPAGMAMWAEGGAGRIALHALAGGAISAGTGGDFTTGAVAAGASQAMASVLTEMFEKQPKLREAFAQIVGLTSAGLATGDYEKGAWISQMADQYNRQAHPEEVRLIKNQAAALAQEQGISVTEAEQRMARAFAYYTDKEWQKLLSKDGLVIEASTMDHLAKALTPLAKRYEPNDPTVGADVPVLAETRQYTPELTREYLQNYASNHTEVFNDTSLHSEYLGKLTPYGLDEYSQYYSRNLSLNPDRVLGTGAFEGIGNALAEMAKGAYGLGQGLVYAPENTTLALLHGLASNNPLAEYQEAKGLANLYRLQGNYDAAARVEMEWQTGFATSLVAAGRAGKISASALAEFKAQQEAAWKGLDGPSGVTPVSEKGVTVGGGAAKPDFSPDAEAGMPYNHPVAEAGGAKGAGEVAGSIKNFSIADRVFGQLNDPRMGQLAGKLDADALQNLANNPSATRFMDARTGHINVIQEVEGKLIRITVPRDEMKIISVGPIRPNQVKNLLGKGDFVQLP